MRSPRSLSPSAHTTPTGSRSWRRRWDLLLRSLHDLAAGSKQPAAASAQSEAAAPPAALVSVAVAARSDFPVYLDSLGQAQAYNTVTVRTRVDGQVVKIAFEEGQMVKAGDLMAQIDARPYQAALDQAKAKKTQDEANLTNAKLDLQRYSTLARQSFATQQQVDTQNALVSQLIAQIAADAAAIDAAAVQLDYTTIRAPISGRAGFRLVDEGNIVAAAQQTGIVTIAQLEPISVVFTEPEQEVTQLNQLLTKGAPELLAKTSDESQVLGVGKLVLTDNQVDVATGSIRLKGEFANKDHKLWPGLAVATRLTLGELKNVVVVPTEAIQHGPTGLFVYVVDGQNRAALRPVTVTHQDLETDRCRQGGERRRQGRHRRRLRPPAGLARDDRRNRKFGELNRCTAASPAPFIRHPVATTLIMVAILLAGIVAYPLLPVAPLPQIDFPTITVSATLPGASPETMASSVAQPLERQIAQIPGVSQMTSTSQLGATAISVQFDLDRNIDAAANDIQAAINAASGYLPKDLPSPPTYRKVNPSDAPILIMSVNSDVAPITEVDDATENILAQQISQIRGVSLVRVGGQQTPAIRIQIDPAKLVEKNLQLEDVRAQLGIATVDSPKGAVNGVRQSFTIYDNDQITEAKDWNNIIVAYRNGAPVRIRDIGRAVSGPADDTQIAWTDGKRGVFLVIFKEPGSNVIKTVQRIKQELVHLEASIPANIHVTLTSDRTTTIRASVDDVQFTLMLTIALVVMVIFVFLRNAWATFIPSITVPLGAARRVRRDVGGQLQPRQSFVDGVDDRGRFRGRRRHRCAREHHAPHRERREAVSGRAEGRR